MKKKLANEGDYIAFLVNYFKPTIQLPTEILPGFNLRKASQPEKDLFQRYDDAVNFGRGDSRVYRYHVPFDGPGWYETNEDFTGYVVEFGLLQWARHGRDRYSQYDLFQLACSVSDAGLRPILVCQLHPHLQAFPFSHSFHRHTVLRERAVKGFLKKIASFTAIDVAQIREFVGLLIEISSEHQFAIEAIERFVQVELVSLEGYIDAEKFYRVEIH